ncbi:SSU ribosomal protein S20p [hydrothermal vent metagenome]|uniref:SSU ribosomal protein S20p n=1 Tax=hydrothermal vent metagenome TaxID=652676 RepID=A0A3B1C1Q0_9ZZZZ
MPSHKSAVKRERQNVKRNSRNTVARSSARTAVKKLREVIATGNKEEAIKGLKEVTKNLDTAASKGVIHRNNAANRVSSLASQVSKLG